MVDAVGIGKLVSYCLVGTEFQVLQDELWGWLIVLTTV